MPHLHLEHLYTNRRCKIDFESTWSAPVKTRPQHAQIDPETFCLALAIHTLGSATYHVILLLTPFEQLKGAYHGC
jgi:hypothetical protein